MATVSMRLGGTIIFGPVGSRVSLVAFAGLIEAVGTGDTPAVSAVGSCVATLEVATGASPGFAAPDSTGPAWSSPVSVPRSSAPATLVGVVAGAGAASVAGAGAASVAGVAMVAVGVALVAGAALVVGVAMGAGAASVVGVAMVAGAGAMVGAPVTCDSSAIGGAVALVPVGSRDGAPAPPAGRTSPRLNESTSTATGGVAAAGSVTPGWVAKACARRVVTSMVGPGVVIANAAWGPPLVAAAGALNATGLIGWVRPGSAAKPARSAANSLPSIDSFVRPSTGIVAAAKSFETFIPVLSKGLLRGPSPSSHSSGSLGRRVFHPLG